MSVDDVRRLLGTVERALSRFDQDRRSARMIGELAVSELRRRLADRAPASLIPQDVPRDPQHHLVSETTQDAHDAHVDGIVHPLSLMGVSEVLAVIEEMPPQDLESFRLLEESGRRRPAVLAAIDRRMSSGTT